MNDLNGICNVEVEHKRYITHPNGNTIIRERKEPKNIRTQYQVHNETKMRKDQEVNKNDNNELEVKHYQKRKEPIIQQTKINLPNCPDCKQNNWIEFNRGYYCQNCEFIISKQKHQIDKKKYLDKISIFLRDYLMLIKT